MLLLLPTTTGLISIKFKRDLVIISSIHVLYTINYSFTIPKSSSCNKTMPTSEAQDPRYDIEFHKIVSAQPLKCHLSIWKYDI